MSDLSLDTTTTDYRRLLSAQRAIEAEIRPLLRIVTLLMTRGEHAKARRLIGRNPLLQNEIRKGRKFQDFAGDDV